MMTPLHDDTATTHCCTDAPLATMKPLNTAACMMTPLHTAATTTVSQDFLGRDLRLFGVDDAFIEKLKWMDRFVKVRKRKGAGRGSRGGR